jgi:hypothetical protein
MGAGFSGRLVLTMKDSALLNRCMAVFEAFFKHSHIFFGPGMATLFSMEKLRELTLTHISYRKSETFIQLRNHIIRLVSAS